MQRGKTGLMIGDTGEFGFDLMAAWTANDIKKEDWEQVKQQIIENCVFLLKDAIEEAEELCAT